MRITDRTPVPPTCLAELSPRVPDPELRDALAAAFVSEKAETDSRAYHTRLDRPADAYVSPRDELCAWTLACVCGSPTGKLLGLRKDDVYVPPVVHACTACTRTVALFDESRHGWNAEVSRRPRRPKAVKPSTFALRCPACKSTTWRTAVVVTYQGDPTAYAPLADRWPDFFDVLAVGGTCDRCEAVTLPAAFECA